MTGLSDTTRTLDADLLVIGWGKAGKTLAKDLGSRGRRVVLVERDDAFTGGSCINVACVPTKDLIDSAEHRAGAEPAAYLRQAIASRDGLVARLRAANRAMLETVEAVTLIGGEASFIGPRRVLVRAGDETLEITADQIVINTGSSPLLPELPGIDGPNVHTSQSIQHIATLPERLAIIGGGFIAMEGKSSLGRLGLLTHSTAGFIDPGFSGHVTLELSNTATMPIKLWPGMKVGQLCFFRLSSPAAAPYGQGATGSRYQGQRGPTASRSHLSFHRIRITDPGPAYSSSGAAPPT